MSRSAQEGQHLNAEYSSATTPLDWERGQPSVGSALVEPPEAGDCRHNHTSQALEEGEHDLVYHAVPGGAANVQDIYPLSALQEGILFHHLLDKHNDTYILSTLIELPSLAEAKSLAHALEKVIVRHDVLRTAFLWHGLSKPVQVVHRKAALRVETLQLTDGADPLEQMRTLTLRPGTHTVMHIGHAPLMRMLVATHVSVRTVFAILQVHHLVCDHRSLGVLIDEAMDCLRGHEAGLPAPLPYRDYVHRTLSSVSLEASAAFFKRKFIDLSEPALPFGITRVRSVRDIDEVRDTLGDDLCKRIRDAARSAHVSPARFLHAAWALVIAQTSAREDVVFGTVLLDSSRREMTTDRMLGMAVNTLPLRVKVTGTTLQFVQQVHRELSELIEHEHAPLPLAQRCSGLDVGVPCFTTLFNFRHRSSPGEMNEASLSGVRVLERGEAWTTYPIAVTVDDLGDRFGLIAQVDRRVNARRVLEYLRTAAQALTAALVEAPNTLAADLSVLPASERYEVLEGFNATAAVYPRDRSLHRLFEEQVQRSPLAIAATYESQVLTFGELNRKANQLARYLQSSGLGIGNYVPIVMQRSFEMLIAEIAILKAGGAYVPVDPKFPVQRQAFMVRDCQARVVFTDDRGEEVAGGDVHRLVVNEALACAAELPGEDLPWDGAGHVAAYVMYTSGSTGTPKGVVVPHRAVARLAINNGYAAIGATDCVAHCSNPAFDASTFEIWAALLNGARLVIVSQERMLDPKRFAAVIEREGVTTIFLTTGLFGQYAGALSAVFSGLSCVITGGDVLEPTLVRRVLGTNPPRRLLNAYGPTECTTFTTTYEIKEVLEGALSIPIGRPLSNTRVYILDARQQPVPVGVVGEIYVGGDGIAVEYLNQPELTTERFLHDPFGTVPEARMYKTGDLGRWNDEGTIEFVGRRDEQVKIRGFRIELGEIEAQLLLDPNVTEAAVVVREEAPGDKRLVAYVVCKDANKTETGAVGDSLRALLRGVLPEHMVPSAFVVLPKLPLTSNGKVDRRGLPAPDLEAYARALYEKPQGTTEEILATLWAELLKVPQVGRRHSFFDLGGHSLLAMRLATRIADRFHLDLSVRAIFECPVLHELALRIEAEQPSGSGTPAHVTPARTRELQEEIARMNEDEVVEEVARLERALAAQSQSAE